MFCSSLDYLRRKNLIEHTCHFEGGRRGSLYARKQFGLFTCINSDMTGATAQIAPPDPLAPLPKKISSLLGKSLIWLDRTNSAPPLDPLLLENVSFPLTDTTQSWKVAAPAKRKKHQIMIFFFQRTYNQNKSVFVYAVFCLLIIIKVFYLRDWLLVPSLKFQRNMIKCAGVNFEWRA